VIAWFSQGHLSHVDAILPDGNLLGSRTEVCKGIKQGVHVRPFDYLRGATKKVVRMTIPCTDTQKGDFYTFLYSQIGKPYDRSAILGFIVNRNWRDTNSWYCMELIAAALEKAGIVPDLYLAANKITPVAGALVVSAIGGTLDK